MDVSERLFLFFQWLLSISIGAVAHNGMVWVWMRRGWLPEKKSLKGLFPLMLGGALATIFLLTLTNLPYLQTWADWWEGVFSILAICILMQALIYPTKVYEGLLGHAKERARRALLDQGEVLELQGESERLLIPLAELSAIFVEDHYLHFIYRDQGEWKKTMLFGRLKDWEEKFPHLLRPNRSWLLNPLHVEALEEGNIRMAGVSEGIKLSESRKEELEQRLQLGS